jgi:hypothetical protein
MTDDALVRLIDTLQQIRDTTDRSKQQPLWRDAFNLLKKLPVDANRGANAVAGRNVTALAQIVAELRAAAQPSETGAIEDSVHTAASHDVADEETLKAALKLFRRREKFARLDEESRLGRGPIGSGHRIQSFAIEAPPDYPRAVWDALARRGQLRSVGKGFYELTDHE